MTIVTERDIQISQTILSYIKDVFDAKNMEEKCDKVEVLFNYIYLNKALLDKLPKFKSQVERKLLEFQQELITDIMRRRLQYYQDIIFQDTF